MFVILVNYIKPQEEIDKCLVEHRAYLDKFVASGLLLCSGPRVPRTGGLIVATAASKAEIEEFIRNDPFTINGVSKCEIIEFNLVKCTEKLKPLIVG